MYRNKVGTYGMFEQRFKFLISDIFEVIMLKLSEVIQY